MRLALASAAALVCAAAAAFGKVHVQPSTSPSEAEIQKQFDRFDAAWSAHDPAQMASVFTEDAMLITPLGSVADGKAKIEKLFAQEHANDGSMRETTLRNQVTRVRMLCPDVAVVDTRMTLTGLRAANGDPLPPQNPHGLFVLTRTRGEWRVQEGRPYWLHEPHAPGVGSAGQQPK